MRSCWCVCAVCWWEDDGQKDDRGAEVWGGPNGKYSLFAARSNFEDHGHMYDAGAGIKVVENPSPERQALMADVDGIRREPSGLDPQRFRFLLNAEQLARDLASR